MPGKAKEINRGVSESYRFQGCPCQSRAHVREPVLVTELVVRCPGVLPEGWNVGCKDHPLVLGSGSVNMTLDVVCTLLGEFTELRMQQGWRLKPELLGQVILVHHQLGLEPIAVDAVVPTIVANQGCLLGQGNNTHGIQPTDFPWVLEQGSNPPTDLSNRPIVVVVVTQHKPDWNARKALLEPPKVGFDEWCRGDVPGDHNGVGLVGRNSLTKLVNLLP